MPLKILPLWNKWQKYYKSKSVAAFGKMHGIICFVHLFFLPYLFFRSCNNFLRFLDFWSNGGTCQMQIVVNAFLGFCLRPTYTWLCTQEDLNILKAYWWYSEVYSRHRDCNEFHMVSALLLPHTTQYCNAGVAKENCHVFKSQH